MSQTATSTPRNGLKGLAIERRFSSAGTHPFDEIEWETRDAVIGVACDAWMLYPNWIPGTTTPASADVRIEHCADHIDHICQLSGNTRHSAIGSDLDGGYGREQCPRDLDSIADLQRLAGILAQRGYNQADVESILHGNWVRQLMKILS